MLRDEILDYLSALGQRQLFIGVDALSPTQQESFYAQLKKYDSLILKRQRETLFNTPAAPPPIEPLQKFERSGSVEHAMRGREMLAQGKVGCIILAGGHGSRLGSKQPKGTLPLTPVKGKSLLQLFLEKTLAASKQAGHQLPVAIMTSPLNHIETLSYLEKNHRFGVKEENCQIFVQKTLPYLDDRGNWLLEAAGVLAEGADGNGEVLAHFFNAGLWSKWKERGVELVSVILIDNPLADPFDAEQIGYHSLAKADLTLKGIMRQHAQEKVGVFGSLQNRLRVIEYSELPEEQKKAVDVDGSLRWKVANTSLFCISMQFIERLVKDPRFYLPWHMARKQADVLLSTAQGSFKERANVWKCETFIFDLLPFTEQAKVLVYPREESFAPFKTEQDLESVQKALLSADRRVFAEVTGKMPPERPFELDSAFYYPTEDVLKKWKGKELPEEAYVEA